MTYVFDHARQQWVDTPATRTMQVHPPATTRPCGFVLPEPDPEPIRDLKHLAGGWAKRP